MAGQRDEHLNIKFLAHASFHDTHAACLAKEPVEYFGHICHTLVTQPGRNYTRSPRIGLFGTFQYHIGYYAFHQIVAGRMETLPEQRRRHYGLPLVTIRAYHQVGGAGAYVQRSHGEAWRRLVIKTFAIQAEKLARIAHVPA